MTIKHENLPRMQSLSLFLTKLIAIYYIRFSNSDDFAISCMLGNFSCFYCLLLTFFKNHMINFFKRFFQEHYQSLKWFGSISGPTDILSVLIWIQNHLLRLLADNKKSSLARKELIPTRNRNEICFTKSTCKVCCFHKYQSGDFIFSIFIHDPL